MHGTHPLIPGRTPDAPPSTPSPHDPLICSWGGAGDAISCRGSSRGQRPLKGASRHFPDFPITACVSLGSNSGDSADIMRRARQAVETLPKVKPVVASSLYRTEPQGFREQPFFLNQVLLLACAASLHPESLLASLLAVETALGRTRETHRFGPRTIDLDLLLFGNKGMNTESLTLPHPRMLDRAFVLVPLAEIAPDLPLPGGLTPVAALERLEYRLCGDCIYQNANCGP